MKRIRKSKKAAFIVIVLLLLISIGYAALTTNLTIGGSATVKKQTFSVYFNNVQVNQSSVSGAKVTTAPSVPANSTSTTTLTWAVTLDTPGEFYEFNVDIVNGGSMDAMVNTATNNIVSTLTQAQQAYLDYTVTYVNGAAIERYDKLAVGETKTITVRLEFKQDVNPGDLPTEGASEISLSFSSDYVPADGNAVEKVTALAPAIQIGDRVNYSTRLNGQNLNNCWKVFYIDGDYTYIILDDFLLSSCISNDMKTTYDLVTREDADEPYDVSNFDKEKFVEAMATTSNWADLVNNGSINGTPLSSEVKNNENVYAMGAPTIELWTSSWNTQYPDDAIYYKYITSDNLGTLDEPGYAVGYTQNPNTTYVNVYGKPGHDDKLYFPHKDDMDDDTCGGHWLASISTTIYNRTLFVDDWGDVGDWEETSCEFAFRPVICLPTSLLSQ